MQQIITQTSEEGLVNLDNFIQAVSLIIDFDLISEQEFFNKKHEQSGEKCVNLERFYDLTYRLALSKLKAPSKAPSRALSSRRSSKLREEAAKNRTRS